MEVFFFHCSMTFFALLVSVFLFLHLLFTRKSGSVHYKLPPGKMGLPFLGESLQFLSAGWKGQPVKFFQDRISKYASNVFKTSIFGESTIVMCGAAANKFLFTNENKLVTAWIPKSIDKIFASAAYDETFKKTFRKLLSILRKTENLQGYVGVMDDIAQRHFATDWEGKQEVVVSPLAQSFTFRVACKLFVGTDDVDHVTRLGHLFDDILVGLFSIPINLPGTPFSRGIKASKLLRKELKSFITQRKIDLGEGKASPTQDLLSLMLTHDENGQYIKESFIVSAILGILLAGQEPTSVTITSIVSYLAEFPDIYEEVLKEQLKVASAKKPGELLNWNDILKMKYSWNVACEALRLAPPTQGGFKEALDDFIFEGFHVPKGWKIYWSALAVHKNPEYFPNPEKFDPSRFQGHGPAPYTYVPFGGGPRICPGNEYARVEILVFIHNIVKRFELKKLVPDEKIIVNPMPKFAQGLPIHIVPRRT